MRPETTLHGITPTAGGLTTWGIHSSNPSDTSLIHEHRIFTAPQIKALLDDPKTAQQLLTPYAYRRLKGTRQNLH